MRQIHQQCCSGFNGNIDNLRTLSVIEMLDGLYSLMATKFAERAQQSASHQL